MVAPVDTNDIHTWYVVHKYYAEIILNLPVNYCCVYCCAVYRAYATRMCSSFYPSTFSTPRVRADSSMLFL